jgi:hypothetical protein
MYVIKNNLIKLKSDYYDGGSSVFYYDNNKRIMYIVKPYKINNNYKNIFKISYDNNILELNNL